MARDLTAGMITELTAGTMYPVMFLKLEFDGGDVNLWTGIRSITFAGDEYIAVGHFLGMTPLNESLRLVAPTISFRLSGIPSTNIAFALGEDYQERYAKLWLGALDVTTEALIVDPQLVLTGRMDVMEIQEGGDEAIISLTVVNRLVDLERPKDRYYTDEDQREHFALDAGLEFVTTLNDGRVVVWGSR